MLTHGYKDDRWKGHRQVTKEKTPVKRGKTDVKTQRERGKECL
jgi:hypothetical protein